MTAAYAYLSDDEWETRISAAGALASACRLCPRACGVDRSAGQRGYCRAPGEMVISSIFAHHGEEPPISGAGGSGTVFFTHCTLGCCFCQNYQISHEGEGRPYSAEELARRLIWLQKQGCHNVNLVTPDHFLPRILRALRAAAGEGLTLPIVYNCSGYASIEALAVLRGVVDIYLPDMKYGDAAAARRYSNAPDYVERNQAAIREMFRQVGPLRVGENGIAQRGLCIRHLVLPNGEAASGKIAAFLASAFDPADIFISLMAQYRPLYRAGQYPQINRMVTAQEYEAVRNSFIKAGFRGYFQRPERLNESFVIDFSKRKSERLLGE